MLAEAAKIWAKEDELRVHEEYRDEKYLEFY